MIATRVLPCLLLSGPGFVKTEKFKNPKYLGDPRNIVKIFNEKEIDEIVVLDIDASRLGRGPQIELIREIVDEAFVPVAYGGGIRSTKQAREVLSLGVEKIVVNTGALDDPRLIEDLAEEAGRQSVVASIDAKRTLFGKPAVYRNRGSKKTRWAPADLAQHLVERGAGEILLQSIDRDGTRAGLDIDLIRSVSEAVDVPVVACGGAGDLEDLVQAVRKGGAAAVAAGSMFVFTGPHRAVLISFPEHDELVAAGLRTSTPPPPQSPLE